MTPDNVKSQIATMIATFWAKDYRINEQRVLPSNDFYNVARNDTYKCENVVCTGGVSIPKHGSVRYGLEKNKSINLYFNTENGVDKELPAVVTRGIKIINDTIGHEVFNYRGVVNVSPDTNSSYYDYSSIPSEGGMIISLGTAVNTGDLTQCGTISDGPNSQSIAAKLLNHHGYFQENKGWTWINLGGAGCGYDEHIVAHEFAHALGMDEHFPGFGDGDIFDAFAKSVLNTLYSNPAGVEANQMEIHLVK